MGVLPIGWLSVLSYNPETLIVYTAETYKFQPPLKSVEPHTFTGLCLNSSFFENRGQNYLIICISFCKV